MYRPQDMFEYLTFCWPVETRPIMENWQYMSPGFPSQTHTRPRRTRWADAPHPIQSHLAHAIHSFEPNYPHSVPASYQRSIGRQSSKYHNRQLPWPIHLQSSRRIPQRPRPSHQTETLNPIRLGRKPRDWRSSFKSSKGGLGGYSNRIGSIIPRVPTHSGLHRRFRLNPIISYRTSVSYDLRGHPILHCDPGLRVLDHSLNTDELHQLASSPPTLEIRLWHCKLPWYISITASKQSGVSIEDIFNGIYEDLGRAIGYDEYYTSDLTAEDREMLNMAFQRRCRGDKAQIRCGVRRVDFLGQDCYFAGISRSRNGTWELKTLPRVPERMMLD